MTVSHNKHLVRPGLIESKITESPDTFAKLGEGFKKIFLDNTNASANASSTLKMYNTMDGRKAPTVGVGSPKPVVIPIAGYAGHRKGEAAENLFGKAFREITIKSKIIERGGLQKQPRNPFMIQRGPSETA